MRVQLVLLLDLDGEGALLLDLDGDGALLLDLVVVHPLDLVGVRGEDELDWAVGILGGYLAVEQGCWRGWDRSSWARSPAWSSRRRRREEM